MIIKISEQTSRINNLIYIQRELSELSILTGLNVTLNTNDKISELIISFLEDYYHLIKPEIEDRIGEIISIGYKYMFFKEKLKIGGLTAEQKELLYTGLIAADLEDDKKYAVNKLKTHTDYSIDGIFNFRMRPLIDKWNDILALMPNYFGENQLKDFIGFLLENKKKRIFVEEGKVYDIHFKRLLRSQLLDGNELKIIKEILLSNCGEVELKGNIPIDDEKYLKEFYRDRVYFS